MKNIRDSCISYFQNKDRQKELREIIEPVFSLFYNEVYIYIWFICIYHVILIFIVLANLLLLVRLFSAHSGGSVSSI